MNACWSRATPWAPRSITARERGRTDGVRRRGRSRDVTRMHTADPGNRVPHLAFQPDQLSDTPILPMEEVETSYYLRLRVLDRPGVLADITRILADNAISIDAMVQKEPGEGEEQVDIVMLTHLTVEKRINAAIAKMESLPTMSGRSRASGWKSWDATDDRTGAVRPMKYISTRGGMPPTASPTSCWEGSRPMADSPFRRPIRR